MSSPANPWQVVSSKPVTQDEWAVVSSKTAPSQPAQNTPTALDQALTGNYVADAGIGAGKSAASHLLNLASFVNGLSGGTLAHLVPDSVKQSIHELRPYLEPHSPAQKAGAVAETVAETLAPVGMVQKASTGARSAINAAQTLPAGARAALGLAAETGINAAASGATAAAQGVDATTGALLGGGLNLATAAATKIAPILASRVEMSLVKPVKADVENGFSVGNIFKHKLGGSLGDTYTKSQDRIEALGQEMSQLLKESGADKVDLAAAQEGKGIVNLRDVLDQTAAQFKKPENVARNFAINKELDAAKEHIADMIQSADAAAPNGYADLLTANRVKQSIGELGAWKHAPSGQVVSNADKAVEKFANSLYRNLNTAIQDSAGSAGPRLQAINKELSEIIPIKLAVVRRIPVEQRQNLLNLGDLAGWSTGHLGLSLLNRALRAGQTANVLSQLPTIGGDVRSAFTQGIGAMSPKKDQP